MKVLITGASGMVGRNTMAHEKAKKFEVLAPSRQELDLTNYSALVDFLCKKKPDIIIHAAGKVGGIKANIADPYGFLMDNLTLGVNIIKAAKECGVARLLNLGSSCIYPRDGLNPLRETAILTGPLEPTNEAYALSKILAIRMCTYINDQYRNLSYKSIIPCNLYGPFDTFDGNNAHLIPAIISKVHEAVESDTDTVTIWGDGTVRREFMFSGDLADLIWDACDKFDSLPQNMNAGLGYDLSVREYYEEIASVIGFSGEFRFDLDQPVGMTQKLTCTDKAKEWGWHPTTDLGEGIKITYQFFKDGKR